MASFRHYSRFTRAVGALFMLSLAPLAAQADQLADIQHAGVVRVATFDANPPFAGLMPNLIVLSVMTWISPAPLPTHWE